jgi:hypothetical protein
VWGIKKFNLDDLYVRFFRLAERRIAEKTGKGVICYISNFSYLSDPSFVVMRKRFLQEFDKLWFDCLNGDSRETGKVTPDGKPDPSIFSTEYNREGIRVGTAIGLMVRKEKRDKQPTVRFKQFWGVKKREELLDSIQTKKFDIAYETTSATTENKYSFEPSNVSFSYLSWPKVIELSNAPPYNGPIERRGNSLIVLEKERLNALRSYLDESNTDAEIRLIAPNFMKSAGEFEAEKTRKNLKGKVKFSDSYIVKYPFKPFDIRFSYLDSDIQPLFSRPSPELLSLRAIKRNTFFITRDTADKAQEGVPFYYSSLISDYDSIAGHARHFPLVIHQKTKSKVADKKQTEAFDVKEKATANLSDKARGYLTKLAIINPDKNEQDVSLVWMHSLAIGYTPAYLSENADGIRQDWPRIPLPKSAEVLHYSATLGKRIAELLDTENDVCGITGGTITPEMKIIAEPQAGEGKQFQSQRGHFDLTAGWGHGGKDGVTMPGKGKIVRRDYTKEELAAIEKGAKARGLTLKQALVHLGETTCDIYLNDTAYWRNVPEKVWEYTIGGYQVIKKWLSYREKDLLGRALTGEEVKEVMNMARRITGILWLEPELNANYKKVKSATYKWCETSIGLKKS